MLGLPDAVFTPTTLETPVDVGFVILGEPDALLVTDRTPVDVGFVIDGVPDACF